MATVIMSTLGTSGDVVPFLQIGRELIGRGHRAVLLTNCAYQQRAEDLGITFEAVDTPEAFQQLMDDQVLLDRPQGSIDFARRNVFPKVRKTFELIEKYIEPKNTILLARSTPAIASSFISEKHGIPLVLGYFAPLSADLAHVVEQLGKTAMSKDNRACRESCGLSNETEPDPFIAHHLCLWPDWYAAPKPTWPKPYSQPGFIFDATKASTLPEPVEQILAAEKKPIVAYTAIGKVMAGFEPEFFKAVVRLCESLDRPGILICKEQSWLPEELPDSIVSQAYLPLHDVLARSALFIHHGGSGSIATGLAASVPQLIVPHGGDRPDNAERLVALGDAKAVSPEKCASQIEPLATELIGKDVRHREIDLEASVAQCTDTILASLSVKRESRSVTEPKKAPASAAAKGALADRLKNLTPAQKAALVAKLREKQKAKAT